MKNQKSLKNLKTINVIKEVENISKNSTFVENKPRLKQDKNKISIRPLNKDIVKKYNLWKSKIDETNKSSNSKITINSLLNEMLDNYLSSQTANDLYKLNDKYIQNSLNEAIFLRNYSLIQYIHKLFLEIMYQIDSLNIKTNVLLNQILKDDQKKELDFGLARNIEWINTLNERNKKTINEVFENIKNKGNRKDN